MNKREYFYLMRRRKGIKLRQLSEYICISQAMLSQYENNIKELLPEKERKYQQYIMNY